MQVATEKTDPENQPAHRPLPRLVARHPGDAVSAIAIGRNKMLLGDAYVRLIDMRWRWLMLIIATAYCSVNFIFASLYMLAGGVANIHPGDFSDAFFFSVETLATIGYGQYYPVGLIANLLVTVEAVMGFAFLAMLTGLVFAKFSRPTARVMFSHVAVITPHHGVPHLMFRLANQRVNRIVNASLQATVLIEEISEEGHRMRRFIDLPLVREQVPFMLLTWTAMHRIDHDSPLYGMTGDDLRARSAELIVSLTGIDESLAQTIHARFSYLPDEVKLNHKFVDIFTRRPDGRVEIDYGRFHDTIENTTPLMLDAPAASPAAPKPVSAARAEDDAAFSEFVRMCSPD